MSKEERKAWFKKNRDQAKHVKKVFDQMEYKETVEQSTENSEKHQYRYLTVEEWCLRELVSFLIVLFQLRLKQMQGKSGSDVQVDPIVKLLWSKVWIRKSRKSRRPGRGVGTVRNYLHEVSSQLPNKMTSRKSENQENQEMNKIKKIKKSTKSNNQEIRKS